MFDRHPSSSGWIVGQRDVARGEDILDGGSLVFVDGDPAPDRRDAGRFGQSRSGSIPIAVSTKSQSTATPLSRRTFPSPRPVTVTPPA